MNIQFLNLPREHTRSIWREVPRSMVYSVFQKSDGIAGDVGTPRRQRLLINAREFAVTPTRLNFNLV